MFTEGDVREIVRVAIRDALKLAPILPSGSPKLFDANVEALAVEVMRDFPGRTDTEPHAHECEGRLCTTCAEWRARHNLVRHGGCAD